MPSIDMDPYPSLPAGAAQAAGDDPPRGSYRPRSGARAGTPRAARHGWPQHPIMGPMTTPAVLEPWRCPRCDADRAAEDDFCGRCGARRPRPDAASAPVEAAPQRPERDGGFPVKRALILNGIVLGAVLAAVVFGSNGGPGTVTFQPAAWRCDGTERAWTAPVPARALEIRIEWRDGGPEGELRASSTTTRAALEPYRHPGWHLPRHHDGHDGPRVRAGGRRLHDGAAGRGLERAPRLGDRGAGAVGQLTGMSARNLPSRPGYRPSGRFQGR